MKDLRPGMLCDVHPLQNGTQQGYIETPHGKLHSKSDRLTAKGKNAFVAHMVEVLAGCCWTKDHTAPWCQMILNGDMVAENER